MMRGKDRVKRRGSEKELNVKGKKQKREELKKRQAAHDKKGERGKEGKKGKVIT